MPSDTRTSRVFIAELAQALRVVAGVDFTQLGGVLPPELHFNHGVHVQRNEGAANWVLPLVIYAS